LFFAVGLLAGLESCRIGCGAASASISANGKIFIQLGINHETLSLGWKVKNDLVSTEYFSVVRL